MGPIIKSEKTAYVVIGNYDRAPGLCIHVAADARDKNRVFLVNALENAAQYEDMLAELLSLSGRGRKYFHEVFIYQDNLCISVPYFKGTGLITGMESGKLDGHYSKRFGILRDILFMLADLLQLPHSFLLVASRAKNIVVDESGQTRLNFALDQTVLSEREHTKALWRNLASLISLLFGRELQTNIHRRLNLVVDKCNKGLYCSLGELIKELEVLEQGFESPDLKTQSLQKFQKLKQLGKRFIWVGYAVVVAFAVWFLFNFTGNTVSTNTAEVNTIGGYSYAGGHTVNTENIGGASLNPGNFRGAAVSAVAEPQAVDIYLDPSYQIDYTDYIVEPGQSFVSIALATYGTEALAGTICDFNGLTRDYEIRAGMVLRLPHAEQLLALLTPAN